MKTGGHPTAMCVEHRPPALQSPPLSFAIQKFFQKKTTNRGTHDK